MQKHYEFKYSFPSLADVQGIVKKIAVRFEGLPASPQLQALLSEEAKRQIAKSIVVSVEALGVQKLMTQDSVKVVQVSKGTDEITPKNKPSGKEINSFIQAYYDSLGKPSYQPLLFPGSAIANLEAVTLGRAAGRPCACPACSSAP